jgi:hypothetical protein
MSDTSTNILGYNSANNLGSSSLVTPNKDGTLIERSELLLQYANLKGGNIYFVDANSGSNTNSGLSWETAFFTMAKAFTVIVSGDTIIFCGKIREQLTTPAQIFDVTIIGAGNRPRHADSTPDGGQVAANTWTIPAANPATAPLVKVIQQGWRFVNILFAGPTDSDCVQLYRDAGAGNAERDASHAEFINCRFASGYNGINDPGGCFNVKIYQDCKFQALTNFCILGVGNIGAGQGMWTIEGNHFYGFTNGIKICGLGCRIENNTLTDGGNPGTTTVINTVSNGGGGDNFVINNYCQTATANFNTPDMVGNATDVWRNVSIDAAAAGVDSGFEIGQPA